jgi:hypothetical protein
MVNFRKDLLTPDSVVVSKKRRQISSCLKKNGLISLGKGGWLGHRSKDIVSGFIIDAPPLDTYISTFILPAFDRHGFVNLSLGNRIVHCSSDKNTQDECKQAIDYYIANISDINSSAELVSYIDERNVQGHYPIWVIYISYLRVFDFDSAITYLDDGKRARLHRVQLDQLGSISRFVAAHDRDGISRVFENWSTFSERIFGPLDQTFEAL